MSAEPTPVGYRVVQAPDTSTDTVLGATERLRQSRQLMRKEMLELNASSAQAQATNRGPRQHNALMATLIALPVLGPLVESAATWWADHPLRAVAELFNRPSASSSTAEPLIQRHPWAMLLSAAALGGLLMWARPWRFAMLRRAVYSGLMPQVVTSLLSRISTDGLLDLVQSLGRRPGKDAASTPAANEQGQAEPGGAAVNSTLH